MTDTTVVTFGTQGPPGPASSSRLVVGASIPKGSAVITSGANVALATQANLALVRSFAGVAVAAGVAGAPVAVQSAGILDPSITLGAGIADDVGANAAGGLVRATDPTCTSAPLFVGYCDSSGAVFLAEHLGAPSAVALAQTTWYFDGAAGLDTNSGLVGFPLRTWGQYLARIGWAYGYRARMNIQVDLYVTGDMSPSDPMIVPDFNEGPSFVFNIHCVPSVVRSGTLSAVTARDPTIRQSDEIADGSTDWTSDVGIHIIEINVGDAVNGPVRCVALKELSAPNRARVTIFGQRSAADPFNLYYALPIVGDAYTVKQLPKVYGFKATSADRSPSGYNKTIEFANLQGEVLYSGPFKFSDCIGNIMESLSPVAPVFFGGAYKIFACGADSSPLAYFTGHLTNGLIEGAGNPLMFGPMLQACKIKCTQLTILGLQLENHHQSFGMGVYDADTPILLGPTGVLLLEAPIYTSGLTTALMHLFNGGKCCTFNPYTVPAFYMQPGLASDFIVNGQTSMTPDKYASAAPIVCSAANLATSRAGGGFQGALFDPYDTHTCISPGQGI